MRLRQDIVEIVLLHRPRVDQVCIAIFIKTDLPAFEHTSKPKAITAYFDSSQTVS
jgi:hypothetical protein